MSKRNDGFEREPLDFYPTPYEAMLPLLPHLKRKTIFAEPFAGDGAIIRHLARHGHVCDWACDVNPKADYVQKLNALDIDAKWVKRLDATVWITNMPWKMAVLHALIRHLVQFMPLWSLHHADWMHNEKAAPLLKMCGKIVSVGRVQWIPGSEFTGMDNVCWYYFNKRNRGQPVFYQRTIP